MKPMTIEEAQKIAKDISVRAARERYLDSHARYFVQNSDEAQRASLIRIIPLCDYASTECMSKLDIQTITCDSKFDKPKRRDILLNKKDCKALIESIQAVLDADEVFTKNFHDQLAKSLCNISCI